MARLEEIAQRWAFPGHHFADVTPEQVEDVNTLLTSVKRLRQAIETHKAERADNLPGYPPDDFDAKLYADLDESEVRG